jgi:hypothetical protein
LALNHWNNSTNENNSIITDLFYFQVKSTLTCKANINHNIQSESKDNNDINYCHWNSHSFEPYSSLSLAFHNHPINNNSSINLTVSFVFLNNNQINFNRLTHVYHLELLNNSNIMDLLTVLSKVSDVNVNCIILADTSSTKN